MTDHSLDIRERDAQGHWIRLVTLTRTRWLAIFGQLAAILVAWAYLGLMIPVSICLAVVGISAVSNVLSWYFFARSKRLSEVEFLLTLVFDMVQLTLLLFLTGGLTNPFALLLLAPVTIAATALGMRSIVIVGIGAIVLVSMLATVFEPLQLSDGTVLILPELYRFGLWLAMVIGIVFIAAYSRSVTREKLGLAEALHATRLALAREQKLTDIGGVVAAAAHELGTPLATIKLVSSELLDTVEPGSEQAEDIALIREQADRCREILHSMGSVGKDDKLVRSAPLRSVIDEAAAPHAQRGITITFDALPHTKMPEVQRRPEVIHGLRNLIQNAVDFAQAQIWIEADWSETTVTVRVVDDGPGFPPSLLSRIGEPYLRDKTNSRPEYKGMGLGVFIAKTLLERTGAEVSFGNCSGASTERCGARAEVTWNRAEIEGDSRQVLGLNEGFSPP